MGKKDQDRSKEKLARFLLVSYNVRRASYMVRAVAGAYLVYLMYQMFSGSAKSGETLSGLMIAIGVLMMAAGIYFAIGSVYALINGIFEENDPAKKKELDAQFPSEETEEAAAEAVAEIIEETEA